MTEASGVAQLIEQRSPDRKVEGSTRNDTLNLHFPFSICWWLHQVAMANGVHTARIDCNTVCWSVEKQNLGLTRRSRPAACRAESLCFLGLRFDLSRAVAETPQVAREKLKIMLKDTTQKGSLQRKVKHSCRSLNESLRFHVSTSA